MAFSSHQSSGKAPSLRDVAALAGCSPQTASRVARGAAGVRPATRAKVEEAMEKLSYVPNRAAQALRTGSFHTIGVLTQRVELTGESHTLGGVLDAAHERDYTISVSQVAHPEADEVHAAITGLVRQPVEGLIIVQSGSATYEHLALPSHLAVATSDSELVGYYPSASADQVFGVSAAIDHLFNLGHRHIQHVSGPVDAQSAAVRSTAWARRLEHYRLPLSKPIPGGWFAADGYRAYTHLDPRTTAVFCANDEVALGLMCALHENGIRVPGDISIVGFDGLPLGAYSFPPLTTVVQDFHRTGEAMVDLIAAQLDRTLRETDRSLLIPTRLEVRASTGAPA